MPETYGYVRTRRPRISELSGSDPETQRQQLQAAGVALSHIYQDVGVSGTSGTSSRRGWRWLDTMGNIHDLQRRGVRIRSLADNEQSWAQYLVLQRLFKGGCAGVREVRLGAWRGSAWPVRYYPAYPRATATTHPARTVPGAASPAPPGRPAAS